MLSHDCCIKGVGVKTSPNLKYHTLLKIMLNGRLEASSSSALLSVIGNIVFEQRNYVGNVKT